MRFSTVFTLFVGFAVLAVDGLPLGIRENYVLLRREGLGLQERGITNFLKSILPRGSDEPQSCDALVRCLPYMLGG